MSYELSYRDPPPCETNSADTHDALAFHVVKRAVKFNSVMDRYQTLFFT